MDRNLISEAASLPEEASSAGIGDFDELVELHRPRIFRFILASLRDPETAENLTQDCFVKAYKARAQFRGEARLGTWLMQIAANLVRDHQGSSRLKFWRRSLRSHVDLSDACDWIADQQRSPEAIALAKEQVRAIWNAAEDLSERQRTVFLLRFVDDMELLEIAAVTGMKEGTVKAHLFRALQAVRAKLEEPK
jgi:RNA polymerase sigma-70 factor (ECF subfamily)